MYLVELLSHQGGNTQCNQQQKWVDSPCAFADAALLLLDKYLFTFNLHLIILVGTAVHHQLYRLLARAKEQSEGGRARTVESWCAQLCSLMMLVYALSSYRRWRNKVKDEEKRRRRRRSPAVPCRAVPSWNSVNERRGSRGTFYSQKMRESRREHKLSRPVRHRPSVERHHHHGTLQQPPPRNKSIFFN